MSASYTVPVGYTAVLREATFFNPDPLLSIKMSVQLTTFLITLIQVDVAQQASEYWSGRVVLDAGETIEASSAATGDITLSGYLLSAS